MKGRRGREKGRKPKEREMRERERREREGGREKEAGVGKNLAAEGRAELVEDLLLAKGRAGFLPRQEVMALELQGGRRAGAERKRMCERAGESVAAEGASGFRRACALVCLCL